MRIHRLGEERVQDGEVAPGQMPMIAGQAMRFIIVGLVQIGVDAGVFILLTSAGTPVAPANVVARVMGATMGFPLNWHYTFRGGNSAVGCAFVRFIVLWLAATALSTVVVSVVADALGLKGAWLAKPMVDAVLAGLSFMVAKWWVFRA